ncbi:hypothetical protein OSTOST_15663 [Ostertagia ostertagi]
MTSSGFGRKLVIAEIGGPGNLFPVSLASCMKTLSMRCFNTNKSEDLIFEEICESCEAPSSFVFGPGAGPWKVVGRNCEMVADANFSSSKFIAKLLYALGKDNFPEVIRKDLPSIMAKSVFRCRYFYDVERRSETSRDARLSLLQLQIDKQWLRFFTMKAPLVCASVFHSYDPGHKLRMEHTHCYSSHGDAGHYHYDTTPDTVVYEGYFTAAEKIFRFDEV